MNTMLLLGDSLLALSIRRMMATGRASPGSAGQVLYCRRCSKKLYQLLNLPVGELHDALKTPTGRELAQIELPTFRCPSDTGYYLNADRPFSGVKYGDTTAAKSNYVANHGTRFVTLADKLLDKSLDSFGVFGVDSAYSESQIADGTSYTILAGERRSRRIGPVCGSAFAITTTRATPACAKSSAFPM